MSISVKFPGEVELLNELQKRLAGHFDHAKRLLRYWLRLDIGKWLARSSLPPIVLRVSFAMNVKSCRQFASVIELCGRGEGADGATVARAMFETALVVAFVLKARFLPRRFDRKGKVEGRIAVPGKRLNREFRATLFVSHHVLQPEREFEMHKRPKGHEAARSTNGQNRIDWERCGALQEDTRTGVGKDIDEETVQLFRPNAEQSRPQFR